MVTATRTPSKFGRKLQELRERADLSQPQLAERTGLSKGYIGAIEAGTRDYKPSRDAILLIAQALDVHPLELLEAAGRATPTDHGKTARPSFRAFVMGEPFLTADQKRFLIRLYESYGGPRRASR